MEDKTTIEYLKQEAFTKSLIEGKEWCGEKKVEWAKIKTFDLTKEAIIFDLGILAFLGAVNPLFKEDIYLYLGASFALISLIIAFIYMWKVSTENINYLQAKYDVISESLAKLESSYPESLLHYNERMAFIERKLRTAESIWDLLQRASFYLFFLSVLASFIGLVI